MTVHHKPSVCQIQSGSSSKINYFLYQLLHKHFKVLQNFAKLKKNCCYQENKWHTIWEELNNCFVFILDYKSVEFFWNKKTLCNQFLNLDYWILIFFINFWNVNRKVVKIKYFRNSIIRGKKQDIKTIIQRNIKNIFEGLDSIFNRLVIINTFNS